MNQSSFFEKKNENLYNNNSYKYKDTYKTPELQSLNLESSEQLKSKCSSHIPNKINQYVERELSEVLKNYLTPEIKKNNNCLKKQLSFNNKLSSSRKQRSISISINNKFVINRFSNSRSPLKLFDCIESKLSLLKLSFENNSPLIEETKSSSYIFLHLIYKIK